MKRKIEAKTNSELVQTLVKLGLSRDEASCYIALTSFGSLTAVHIAEKVHILPNAVYRTLKRLEQKGFAVTLDAYPVSFQAVPPAVAISSVVQEKEKVLESLKITSLQALSFNQTKLPQTNIDMVTGSKQMFAAYIRLAKEVKEEILIISIGEPVSDEIKIANRDAQERGVRIKFIAHQFDETNRDLLKNWIRMGLEVRYISDKGFHLMIFDRKQSILAASNPENTPERISMIISSDGISRALRDYFYATWEKATPITIWS